jgi:hypothetical protein
VGDDKADQQAFGRLLIVVICAGPSVLCLLLFKRAVASLVRVLPGKGDEAEDALSVLDGEDLTNMAGGSGGEEGAKTEKSLRHQQQKQQQEANKEEEKNGTSLDEVRSPTPLKTKKKPKSRSTPSNAPGSRVSRNSKTASFETPVRVVSASSLDAKTTHSSADASAFPQQDLLVPALEMGRMPARNPRNGEITDEEGPSKDVEYAGIEYV